MKELKDYTREELIAELKRRDELEKSEKRMVFTRKVIEYREFEGVVCNRTDIRGALNRIGFTIDSEFLSSNEKYKHLNRNNYFHVDLKKFNKKTMPKLGDRVKLRYRIVKEKKYQVFHVISAKISEIVE